MGKIIVSSVGDIYLDMLLAYGLYEVCERVDPLIKLNITLGSDILCHIKSRFDEDTFKKKVLEELSILINTTYFINELRNTINTPLNVGFIGRKDIEPLLDYAKVPELKQSILDLLTKIKGKKSKRRREGTSQLLPHIEFLRCILSLDKLRNWSFHNMGIYKASKGETLYASLYPVYSKCRKIRDSSMSDETMRVTSPLIKLLLMVGLAFYTLTVNVDGERRHIYLVLPVGVSVNKGILSTIRRSISLFKLWLANTGTKIFKKVPEVSLPLIHLSQLDIVALEELYNIKPLLTVFNLERQRGVDVTRMFKGYDVSSELVFLHKIGHFLYEFRRLINSILRAYNQKEDAPITEVFMNMAIAIKSRNPRLLIDAVMTWIKWANTNEVRGAYVPSADAMLAFSTALT